MDEHNNYDFNSNEQLNKEFILKGIPSSPGTAIGKSIVFEPEQISGPVNISEESVPEIELDRFENAIKELESEFSESIESVKNEPGNISAILETNILIITDFSMISSVKEKIFKGYSAESAINQSFDNQLKFFKQSKDRILKERAIEIIHIKERLLLALKNKTINYQIASGCIVVAQSITTSDFIKFRDAGFIALVTEAGGIASHTSILARNYEIPAVIGVKKATQNIHNNSRVIIDGYAGKVISNPQFLTIKEYEKKKSEEEKHKNEIGKLVKVRAKTVDGKKIELLSNIDFIEDVESSLIYGSDGIGLVRTEHLIAAEGKFPDESKQYHWYKDLAERSYPNLVTIRVFDIGSDKYAEGMPKHENNPALGYRGIRFLLSRKDVFEKQIKAILRASKNRNLRILLPMITNIDEVFKSLSIIESCKRNLKDKKIDFDHNIPVGIMIETPSAALMANELAEISDFFSIGTNDLVQYTLAADRTNDLVSYLFDALHPAVIKLIKMTIDAAKNRKIPVGICGELGGNAAATELLIGMGIDEISTVPSIIPEIKSIILSINSEDAKNLAEEILNLSSQDAIRERLYN